MPRKARRRTRKAVRRYKRAVKRSIRGRRGRRFRKISGYVKHHFLDKNANCWFYQADSSGGVWSASTTNLVTMQSSIGTDNYFASRPRLLDSNLYLQLFTSFYWGTFDRFDIIMNAQTTMGVAAGSTGGSVDTTSKNLAYTTTTSWKNYPVDPGANIVPGAIIPYANLLDDVMVKVKPFNRLKSLKVSFVPKCLTPYVFTLTDRTTTVFDYKLVKLPKTLCSNSDLGNTITFGAIFCLQRQNGQNALSVRSTYHFTLYNPY